MVVLLHCIITMAAHGHAMLEPEARPGHPSIQCHVGADPAFTATGRTRSGVAVCAQGDGACGWMTLPAMLAPSTSTWRCSIRSTLAFAFVQRSKLMRQHRALLA